MKFGLSEIRALKEVASKINVEELKASYTASVAALEHLDEEYYERWKPQRDSGRLTSADEDRLAAAIEAVLAGLRKDRTARP